MSYGDARIGSGRSRAAVGFHGQLHQPEEQHPASPGVATVEAEHPLVAVRLQVQLGVLLVGVEQRPFEQRRDPVDPRQGHVRRFTGSGHVDRIVGVALV
jgi:hypothetical protein